MKTNKVSLNQEKSKGSDKYHANDDDNASDSPTEDEILKSYEEYQKELIEEQKEKLLSSEELEDVAGKKPFPMDQDAMIEVLKGHKFKFTLENYQTYLIDARKIAEKILKRTEVNIEKGAKTIEDHMHEVLEPQYRSIFLTRLYQVAIEQVKPRQAAELTRVIFENGIITKQQIRRGLVRLFWKFEDILIDVPLAPQVLSQVLQFLHLRSLISSRILTQIPEEVMEKLIAEQDGFKQHFSKELVVLSTEKEYRTRIQELLKLFYLNFDDSEIKLFIEKEVRDQKLEMFNHLFIRKAIDFALDKSANEQEACSKLLQMLTQEYSFSNPDYGYAFDYLVWNHKEYEVDVPNFSKYISFFISRAIYDGAVTFRYITDAEVAHHGESHDQELIFQQVLNVLSVMPLDYHMKNVWNSALTNEELTLKFKATLKEYIQNQDIDYVGHYLKELSCQYYYHEFVKRSFVFAIESGEDAVIQSIIKLIVSLNNQFDLTKRQIEFGLKKTEQYVEDLKLDVPKAPEHLNVIKNLLLSSKFNE